jgi:hypothetical protein
MRVGTVGPIEYGSLLSEAGCIAVAGSRPSASEKKRESCSVAGCLFMAWFRVGAKGGVPCPDMLQNAKSEFSIPRC